MTTAGFERSNSGSDQAVLGPRIDLDGAEYLYIQLAEDMIRRIESGEFLSGGPIPSERDLAAEYGVSGNTVRSAVRELRRRGAITTLRGKGTYATGG